MKLRTVFKLASITSVMLLCMGYAISLYFKMNAVERAGDFDLYTLVPPDSRLIVDTDNMVGLMQHINELSCSKDNHFLYFSHFFSYLKEHINSFLEQIPHGLSKQMNRMLISFHEPNGDRDQVFYCRLGTGDYEFIEQFIRTYSSGSFPSRFFDYRGEEIRIYPMPGDLFLACHVNTEFLVLSYQKRLIELVIDTRLAEKSILSDGVFSKIRSEHRMVAPVTIYTRMQDIKMGPDSDTLRYQSVGGWTEFNINLNSDAISLSGVNYDADSCETFVNTLCTLKPVDDFPGELLPASAFFFSQASISDLDRVLGYTSRRAYDRDICSNIMRDADSVVHAFLREYAGDDMMTCMLNPDDSLSGVPHAVMNIPLRNRSGVKQALANLSLSTASISTTAVTHTAYALPSNTLFTQLTGVTGFSLPAHACLYNDRLLVSTGVDGLQAYLKAIEGEGTVMKGTPFYENMTGTLSQTYNFMMMADMEQVLRKPENYVCFIPNLFFRYGDFFRYFMLTTQFTCVDGVVYPNLILTYKGGEF